jgi:hypothetical protein
MAKIAPVRRRDPETTAEAENQNKVFNPKSA